MPSLISVCRPLFSIFELGVLVAAVTLFFDMLQRDDDTVNQAWQLVAIAGGISGRATGQDMASGQIPAINRNMGLIDALETLNRRQVVMNGISVSNAYLAGIQLKQARLSGATLENADLSGADLQGAQLRRANLKKAKLQGANLRMADLSGSDLSDANLEGANLWNVNLSAANLERASLNGGANMEKAILFNARLASANLSYADMSEAYLVNTNLEKANLFHAKLCRATIIGTYLTDVRADSAYRTGIVSARNSSSDLDAQPERDACQTEPSESTPAENSSLSYPSYP